MISTKSPRYFSIALIVTLLTASTLAWTQQQTQPRAPVPAGTQFSLLGRYDDWRAYVSSPGENKLCFVIAKPSRSHTSPPGLPRVAAYAFVSSRPTDRVKDEIYILFGYTLMPGTETTAEVDGAKFALLGHGDGGWIKYGADEARLVEAMRNGSDLVVRGVSWPGTQTIDTFSLRGLAQALDRITQECQIPVAGDFSRRARLS
jgi:invasion protein IalB